MPPACERLFPCVFREAGSPKAIRKIDIVCIRQNFGDYIDIGGPADGSGGFVCDEESQCDAADEDDLI